MSIEPAVPNPARFHIERPIGRGGMATVHEVVDPATGRRLALKQLHFVEDARKRRQYVQFFEREFHTLSQLAHPRVVEVYDYGLGEQGPYYTMELLDGGDLNQLAPVHWTRACALARDICSALSLLHSRRMVHRDLSPRNVRCTSDGLAKLIDFGAMAMMGTSRHVVGTPPYCAPEALNLQPLDARTDLYALGATLYYTLVGRHAYPAKDFKQLRDAWLRAPAPPSELVPGIPPALDGLVLDLIHLDPAVRPANAAEVMERLAAIENRAADEHLLVSQSYLCNPGLVGREQLLTRARFKTMRALRGRGGTLMIEAEAGLGRSRLLSACILEAKLLGTLVLRADSADGQSEYGAVRALAAQLLEAAPEVALAAAEPRLALLGYAVPELLAERGPDAAQPFADPAQARAQLLPALQEWLLAVSAQRPLMLAVDDVHAIDEPSAALLALLSRDVRRRAVVIAVTLQSDALAASSPSALKLLSESATKLRPAPLHAEQTELLLRSVFGDVPHVQRVAHRLQAISGGNPRDVMQLAQHLVDRGIVRYQAGAWSLPANIEAAELPATVAQAIASRVERLSVAARELAIALSLIPDTSVTFRECMALCEQPEAGRTSDGLSELLQMQVAQLAGDRYVLAPCGFSAALHAQLDNGTKRRLHLKLSQMFAEREEKSFRAAQHLLCAGEKERGLDALIASAERSQQITHQNAHAFSALARSMPADWYQTFEQALALCDELGRPKRDSAPLLTRLSALLAVTGILERKHLPRLIDQLRRDSGLADWEELPSSLAPMERLRQALELAQQRYANSAEQDRTLEPLVAIRQLTRTIIQAIALIANTIDYALLRWLPSLEPFEPLSPALWVVGRLVQGNGARITGRFEQAREQYRQLFDRTAQPDRGGLDESHHNHMRLGVMSGLGMLEASIGLASCRDWAAKIENEPLHQVNAQLIHMLHHLWQGEMREAERVKERAELLRIQNGSRQWFEGTHLLYQIGAHAAADDLTRVKQTAAEVAVMAQRYPAWVPVRDYALGEYHRVRGDLASARLELEKALSATEAGCHQLWPNAAGAHVRVLFELGCYEEARDQGQRYLEAARCAGLGYALNFILLPFALVLSRLGDGPAATAAADAVIDNLRGLGSTGVLLALAYETRARVAIEVKDQPAFERYAALCAEQLRTGGNRVLAAKYKRLKQTAAYAELRTTQTVTADATEFTSSRLSTMLETCRGPAERALQSLRMLLKQVGANEGLLYWIADGAPELVAKTGDEEVPANLREAVQGYLETEIRDHEVNTVSASDARSVSSGDWTGVNGLRYCPVLLSHVVNGGHAITGIALIAVLPRGHFEHPGSVASELSRITLESGDCSAIVLSY